jgi:hypothetical protein
MKAGRFAIGVAWAVAAVLAVPLAITACSGDSAPGGCRVNGQACSVTCDAQVGCVECAGNGDCGAAKPFCVTGHCSECGASGDCGAGRACYPATHTCQPACTGPGTCNSGDATICDPNTGACVGCLSNQDCGGSEPLCDTVHGQCGQCLGNSDCGAAAPICNVAASRCVQCIVDDQCSGGKCTEGHCVKLCQGNGDCGGTTPLCRTSDGECVACLTAKDCGAAAPVCTPSGRCAQCLVDMDCSDNAAGHFCFENACVQCRDTPDCTMGLKCKGHQCR